MTEYSMMDAWSDGSRLASASKLWSSFVLTKKNSWAAERSAKPQSEIVSAGACRLATVSIAKSKSREQLPDA